MSAKRDAGTTRFPFPIPFGGMYLPRTVDQLEALVLGDPAKKKERNELALARRTLQESMVHERSDGRIYASLCSYIGCRVRYRLKGAFLPSDAGQGFCDSDSLSIVGTWIDHGPVDSGGKPLAIVTGTAPPKRKACSCVRHALSEMHANFMSIGVGAGAAVANRSACLAFVQSRKTVPGGAPVTEGAKKAAVAKSQRVVCLLVFDCKPKPVTPLSPMTMFRAYLRLRNPGEEFDHSTLSFDTLEFMVGYNWHANGRDAISRIHPSLASDSFKRMLAEVHAVRVNNRSTEMYHVPRYEVADLVGRVVHKYALPCRRGWIEGKIFFVKRFCHQKGFPIELVDTIAGFVQQAEEQALVLADMERWFCRSVNAIWFPY